MSGRPRFGQRNSLPSCVAGGIATTSTIKYPNLPCTASNRCDNPIPTHSNSSSTALPTARLKFTTGRLARSRGTWAEFEPNQLWWDRFYTVRVTPYHCPGFSRPKPWIRRPLRHWDASLWSQEAQRSQRLLLRRRQLRQAGRGVEGQARGGG